MMNSAGLQAASTNAWRCALSLSSDRKVTSGSFADLASAIARGADLRLYTEFLHEEHIAPGSTTPGINDARNRGMIRESIDFRETVLVDGSHVAGINVLRQPLEPTTGFNGTQPKMSFFMYNMTGEQSHANLLLEGDAPAGQVGVRQIVPPDPAMKKMSDQESFDLGTSAPCRNFIYDMECYRFFVRDEWTMVLSHDAEGRVLEGSLAELEQAQIACREFKVAIRGIGVDLGAGPDHELFTPVGSGFFHTARRFHETLSHPLLRVAPAIPMQFRSGNWDVSWVSLRTDGVATIRRLDPYTRHHIDLNARVPCRWFVR
jgi:hypothetical protein